MPEDPSGDQPETKTGRSAAATGQPRRRQFACAAIFMALVPFALLELGLRIFGVGDEAVDLHDGFDAATPLFEFKATDSVWRTSLPRQRFFVAQEFPAKKAKDEFRIFCLGGSTVQGRPYEPETSFTKWLELELNAVDPGHKYRCVNCGGISYASYRLRPILQEVLTHEPDLIVLATGHNEFLEDRTYASVKSRSGFRVSIENAARSLRTVMVLRQLTGGASRVEPKLAREAPTQSVEARLDDEAGYASYHRDSAWQDQVRQQYADSVRDMFQSCRQQNVPVVAIQLGANLRDCPPFKSEHRHDITAEDEQIWQRLFDQATQAENTDVETALTTYRQAAEIDDRYPLLHYRMARCLDQLHRYAQASASYERALQEDICPLRMIPAIRSELKQLAEDFRVPVVDAESVIASLSPQQIPGYDAYVDHVHPTIGSHQKIAVAIVDKLVDVNVVTRTTVMSEDERRRLYAKHIRGLGAAYFSNGRRRIGWLEGWARRKRLYDETVPVDSRGYLASAFRDLDLQQFDRAGDNLQMAVVTSEKGASPAIARAAELFSQGRSSAAAWVLRQLRIAALSAAEQKALDLGELILSIDAKDIADTLRIARRRTDWIEIASADQSGWAMQMPDLLETAEILSKDTSRPDSAP